MLSGKDIKNLNDDLEIISNEIEDIKSNLPTNPPSFGSVNYVFNFIPDNSFDSSEGYNIGDKIFVPTTTYGVVNEEYICLDNTNGAAVWKPTSGFYSFVDNQNQNIPSGSPDLTFLVEIRVPA
jgi:hypothetical protein